MMLLLEQTASSCLKTDLCLSEIDRLQATTSLLKLCDLARKEQCLVKKMTDSSQST